MRECIFEREGADFDFDLRREVERGDFFSLNWKMSKIWRREMRYGKGEYGCVRSLAEEIDVEEASLHALFVLMMFMVLEKEAFCY